MGFENIIMIQHEEFVQEVWDTSRKIACDWPKRLEKLVTIKPFSVDLAQAKSLQQTNDEVVVWMDLLMGKGPFSESVDGIVKIGDEMTLVVYNIDNGTGYDMLVKNCIAYDSEHFHDEQTRKIHLSDEMGCILKNNLIGQFSYTDKTGSTGADMLAFASLFAFKFPEKIDVYLACEVELCHGGCINMCDDENVVLDMGLVTSTNRNEKENLDECIGNEGSIKCCKIQPTHRSCRKALKSDRSLEENMSRNNENASISFATSITTEFSPDQVAKSNSIPIPVTSTEHFLVITPTLPIVSEQMKDKNALSSKSSNKTAMKSNEDTDDSSNNSEDPCVIDPKSLECCYLHPDSCLITPILRTDPCKTNPASLECCRLMPKSLLCIIVKAMATSDNDPCLHDPMSEKCCKIKPESLFCQIDISKLGDDEIVLANLRKEQSSGIPLPCSRNPRSSECCALRPDICIARKDDANESSSNSTMNPCESQPGTENCCAENPAHSSCAKKMCDILNDEECMSNADSPRITRHLGQQMIRPVIRSSISSRRSSSRKSSRRRHSRDVAKFTSSKNTHPKTSLPVAKGYRVVTDSDLAQSYSMLLPQNQTQESCLSPYIVLPMFISILSMLLVCIMFLCVTCLRLRSLKHKKSVEIKVNPYH